MRRENIHAAPGIKLRKFAEINKSGKLKLSRTWRFFSIFKNRFRTVPLCTGHNKRIFLPDFFRQQFKCFEQIQMILARMFDAGNIKNLFFLFRFHFCRGCKTIINHRNLLCGDLPISDKIITGRLTDGAYCLSLADIVRKNMLDIEHSECIIFHRDMILGKIMNDSNRIYRITAENTAVRGKHDAEVKFLPVDPPRQDKQTVEHGKQSTPLLDPDQLKTSERFCSIILHDQSQVVSGLFQSLHHFPDIDRNTGFSVIKRDCRQQYFHDRLSVNFVNMFTKFSSENLFFASHNPISPKLFSESGC